ncbi:MAG: ATP-binding protein [Alphaproteobacteria bacterium]
MAFGSLDFRSMDFRAIDWGSFDWQALDPRHWDWRLPDRLAVDWGSLEAAVRDPRIVVLATGIALLVLLVSAFWVRFSRLVREHERAGALSARLRDALAASPDGYYLWDLVAGVESSSPRLRSLLRLGPETAPSPEAIRDRFAPEYRAEFAAALTALRERGIGFDLLLPLVPEAGGAAYSLRVMGVRAVGADDKPAADLVWFRDMSRFVAETLRLRREIDAASGERDQLRALLDALPIPAWLRSPDLSLAFCNRAYGKAIESDPETAVREQQEIAETVIADRGRALAERALLTGLSQSESHHIVIDGMRRLFEFVEVPLSGDGFAGEMVGFAMDFTDLEKVQADLSREIAAHGNVLEHLPTAVALYGADRRLRFFNTAYRRLWRLDEPWLRSGPELGDVLEAQREKRRLPEFADFRAFKDSQMRLFNTLIEPHEELLHLPDETTLRMRMVPHPFGGLLFTYDDVTDKLALERSYNTLIAVQRETLDNLYEGVAVFGGDGRLKLSNPGYARIWKLAPEQLVNEPHVSALVEAIRDFYDVESEEAWAAARKTLIDQVIEAKAQSGRLERSDGSILEVAAVPLPDGNLLLRYVEATDRYRVEQALRERNQALETASRLKSEFIANVSYELRTPLNTIIGFSEILKNEYFGKLNPRQKDYAKGTLEASQALLLLINDIIDLATIEAGYMALELGTVDVYSMLVSVLSLTRERARNNDLTLEFDCSPNIGTVYADQRRLRQAMFNLISNSIKFTPAGGTITVSARREADAVLLSVADTGIGVSKEEHERVFEKFVRGQAGQARPAGAGLGLSLVKSFIELHGGRVTLESAPNEGTKVTCYLPTLAVGEKAAAAALLH